MQSHIKEIYIDEYQDVSGIQEAILAALQELGEWFDWLRQEGLYDNTRILLVSDHGYELWQMLDFVYPTGDDLGSYLPLLLVKDFDSHGFTICPPLATLAVIIVMCIGVVSTRP